MKNETRILLNGLLGDRWETEEDMYSSMAYDIAEDQVVADNAMEFGLAAKLLNDLDKNELVNMYVRSKQ